jgi:acetoin:2,6-dichlorophenolindophenol oxidoreductase subunit beta
MPWTKVFIDQDDFDALPDQEGLRWITYRESLREAQLQMLRRDDRVFIIGEGVDDPGGIFGTTVGLWELFGQDRVMDIAIA